MKKHGLPIRSDGCDGLLHITLSRARDARTQQGFRKDVSLASLYWRNVGGLIAAGR